MKYLILFIFLIGCSTDIHINQSDDYEFEIIYNDFQNPWGFDFIDENTLLITERLGNVILFDLETKNKIYLEGVPEVDVVGQGGLLDIKYHEGWIYLTYSKSNGDGYATHLGRGFFNNDIENFETLKIAEPFMSGGAHFGSRIVIRDDFVYFSTGDRGQKNFDANHVSQDLNNYLGSIIRLNKDGSNAEIFTYGHRNVQGMTLNSKTNEIWITDHGERDGDSISILTEGGNYGWPIAHYGCRYGTNIPVSEDPHLNPDVIDPVYFWECGSGGFPPSGMTFYYGDKFENWQGNLFVGNLAGQYLGRFIIDESVIEAEPLLSYLGLRIRNVKESPNGYLYALSDSGELIKIKPLQ